MVNNAPRGARGQNNQLRRHFVCDAQDDLLRVALRRQLTRRDDAARSQNGVRPRKYALTLYAAFKSLRFARPLEIRVPLFIRPRTRMQEKKLGVARRHFHRNVKRARIAVGPAERNEDAKRFSRDRIHFRLCHNYTPPQVITRSGRRAISDLARSFPAAPDCPRRRLGDESLACQTYPFIAFLPWPRLRRPPSIWRGPMGRRGAGH